MLYVKCESCFKLEKTGIICYSSASGGLRLLQLFFIAHRENAMKWIKYTIRTTTQDAEMVCAVLMDYGITDVQIENNVQLTDEELNQMYADFVKELPEDDGSCAVTFYLDENGFIPEGLGTGDSPSAANEASGYQGIKVDMDAVRSGLQEAEELFGVAPVSIEVSSVDTQDWNQKWKEYFHPFSVGKILIHPSWEEPEETEGKVLIRIDPGMAFGTGTHETTRLCLQAMQKYLQPGMRVLDLGTGSGILGIAALKLGAKEVTAIDIDEQAVKVAEENFQMNCSEGEYHLQTGNILNDADLQEALAKEPCDLVLANILADVIIPVSSFVHRFLKPGGVFISSGILDNKEQDVCRAFGDNPALKLLETEADGDWRAVTASRV